ncbi:hypothetical protein BOX37_13245 [Nocardia mangyaensis]|uniref:Uncharacterized protein n=1 Tax=Nocardia mangyaensis TaxID=2213200 RepID=A0A1J0VS15_9NOCA|nr:hypothetical protein [Nocardia mangyaensis]APE34751.1 hypothetical protein BOX37_13245 [Nocardia mangyaensis]
MPDPDAIIDQLARPVLGLRAAFDGTGSSGDAVALLEAAGPGRAWGGRQDRHDALMFGHMEMTGRNAEDGWQTEVVQNTPIGQRRHDAGQVDPNAHVVKNVTEYKAGWVNRDEGLKQLKKERMLLATHQIQEVSEYVIRASDPPHPEVLAEAKRLSQKFPDRFKLIELSEREFENAIELGRPVVQARAAKKLEKAIEQVRDAPEINAATPALRDFLHEVDKAHERGQPIELGDLLDTRDTLANLVEAECLTPPVLQRASVAG